MFKKLIVNLFWGLVFCFCFQITAHALPGQVFEDFKESDIYYEDVMYFVNQGVITGKGNHLFYPEDLITTAEVITITEKVLGDKENLPEDWNWWQNPTYKNPNVKGWDYDWNFPSILIKGKYTEPASRNTISCILLNIAKQPIVATEPWELNSKNGFENIVYYNNMRARGFWTEEEGYHLGVSRAEFCHILKKFLDNKDFLEPKKEIFVKIKQRYESNKTEINNIVDYYRNST